MTCGEETFVVARAGDLVSQRCATKKSQQIVDRAGHTSVCAEEEQLSISVSGCPEKLTTPFAPDGGHSHPEGPVSGKSLKPVGGRGGNRPKEFQTRLRRRAH